MEGRTDGRADRQTDRRKEAGCPILSIGKQLSQNALYVSLRLSQLLTFCCDVIIVGNGFREQHAMSGKENFLVVELHRHTEPTSGAAIEKSSRSDRYNHGPRK